MFIMAIDGKGRTCTMNGDAGNDFEKVGVYGESLGGNTVLIAEHQLPRSFLKFGGKIKTSGCTYELRR